MKNLKSKLNLAVLGLALTCNMTANAATIQETTKPDGTNDKIAQNSILIGITKFEPNVIITANRVAKATYNDVIFNKENPDYTGVEIHYYLGESWYAMDEDNKPVAVTDEAKIAELNEAYIYYVNNEEKLIDIPYNKTLDKGYEFVFKTDNAKKDELVVLENGNLKVPATVNKVEVFAKETANAEAALTKLDTINTTNLKESVDQVVVKSSNGKIAAGKDAGKELVNKVDEATNTITIGGNMKWWGGAAVQNGRIAGNYGSVTITAPEVYTQEELDKATVTIDKRDPLAWTAVTKYEDVKTEFTFYPRFDETDREHTIKIEWAPGNVQTFTMKLDEATIKLEAAPKASVYGIDSSDYTVNGNEITVGGNIKWAGANAHQIDTKPGYFGAVKIKAPKEYDNEFLKANSSIKVDGAKEPLAMTTVLGYDGSDQTSFVFYPRFDEKTKTHTVEIKWQEGHTETYTFNLDANANFIGKPFGFIEKGDTTGGNLKYTVNGNNVNITSNEGLLKWYPTEEVGNGVSGNYASVLIKAPYEYTSVQLESANITIDNGKKQKWNAVRDGADGAKAREITYWPRFDEKTKSHTVKVEWETGNVQEFVITLDDSVELANGPLGTITKGDNSGGELTYNVETKGLTQTITISGTEMKWYGDDLAAANGRIPGNYGSVIINAPKNLSVEKLAKAKFKIDDREAVFWADVRDGADSGKEKIVTYWPRFDATTRTHTVTVEWEKGNVQTFIINLDETLKLEAAPASSVEMVNKQNYTVEGYNIVSNGELKWASKAGNQNGREAGFYDPQGIQFNAPKGYTRAYLDEDSYGAKVKIDDEVMTMKAVLAYEDPAATSFIYYPRFDENTKSHTVEITWQEGHTETYTITLGEATKFVGKPAGTVTDGGATGGDLKYTIKDNNINITANKGELAWYKGDPNAENGRIAGNYAAVKFTAPEGYDAKKLANTTVKIDDRKPFDWNTNKDADSDVEMTYYPRFDENTKKHTVTITWEAGDVETFTITLDPSVKLAAAPESIVKMVNEKDYVVEGHNIISNGKLKFVEADPELQNGREKGYYDPQGIEFLAPKGYTHEDLINPANKGSLKIDDREPDTMANVLSYEPETATSFIYYPKFNETTKTHTVEITWEKGYTETYTITLGDKAEFVGDPRD